MESNIHNILQNVIIIYFINFTFFCCNLVNVANVGQDDSSSEEAQSHQPQTTNNKPIVPPRPRSIAAVDYKRNGVPANLSNNKPTKNNKLNEDVPCKDNDVANGDCECHKTWKYLNKDPNLNLFFVFILQ